MKIEHIALYVNDLNAARDFFIRYLGAVSNDGYYNAKTGFRSFFLRFEDGARLEIMKKPGIFARASFDEQMGYAHIAFSLGSIEKVDWFSSCLISLRISAMQSARVVVFNSRSACVSIPWNIYVNVGRIGDDL